MDISPLVAVALPKELQDSDLIIEKKGIKAPLQFSYVKPSSQHGSDGLIVVFVNGLMLPQTGWHPVIAQFMSRCKSMNKPWPAMLTYDRFGQGRTTARDPLERADGAEPGHSHDVNDAASDLITLTDCFLKDILGHSGQNRPPLLLVANSIGCVISRIFAQRCPSTVAGMIFLDSMMSDTDFVSLWPDPDDPKFDPKKDLPGDVSVEALRETRMNYRKLFYPSVPNAEGLSRRNVSKLLPYSNKPLLEGFKTGLGPLVLVVGHDPDVFARENEKMGTPVSLCNMYINKAWAKYNEGLLQITNPERAKGPSIAPGCGHFIQRDDPAYVATSLWEMLVWTESDLKDS